MKGVIAGILFTFVSISITVFLSGKFGLFESGIVPLLIMLAVFGGFAIVIFSNLGDPWRKAVEEDKEEAYKAGRKFAQLQIEDPVRTTTEYCRRYRGEEVSGTVIGKRVIPRMEELEDRPMPLVAGLNDFAIKIQTADGEVKELNVIWLEKMPAKDAR